MARTTFYAVHPRTGEVAKRSTERGDYHFAVFHTDGRVTWHNKRHAAQRTAPNRTYGIVETTTVKPEEA